MGGGGKEPKGKNKFWNRTILVHPVIHLPIVNADCYVPSTMGYKTELFSIYLPVYLLTHFIIMLEVLPGPGILDVAVPGQLGSEQGGFQGGAEPALEIPGLRGECWEGK